MSYTGAGGDIAQLLGDVAGFQAAFAFDAATQQWLAFRFGVPAFLNQVTRLERLDGLFLLVEAATTWAFTEAGPTSIAVAASG